MKKLSLILLAFVLLFGTSISTATELEKDKKTIAQELGAFLKDANFDLEADINATVTFMINDKNEIVVLTVDTEDIAVERFIKSRLNYKKLQNRLKVGEEYQVPVVMKA